MTFFGKSARPIAARTGFYPSTVLRLTASLIRFGYLHRASDGLFRLGPTPLRLAVLYRESFRLTDHVRPALARLVGEAAPRFLRGTLAAKLDDKPNPRETLWPARLDWNDGPPRLHPLAWASSGDVTCLTVANALIRVPANLDSLEAGAELEFLPTYSPNLNLIERYGRWVKKQCLNAQYHADFATMKAALLKTTASAHHEHASALASLLTWNFQLFPKTHVTI